MTSQLNTSSWYNPGFNLVGTPRQDSRVAVDGYGAFSKEVLRVEAGGAQPSSLVCVLLTLENVHLEYFTHLENIEATALDGGATSYVFSMPPGKVPVGNSKLRVYVDGYATDHYVCNNHALLEGTWNAILLSTYQSGSVEVPEGAESVSVVFPSAMAAVPVVVFSLHALDELVQGVVTASSAEGFTVTLASAAPAGTSLHWMAAPSP
jgi:hypothetical protein